MQKKSNQAAKQWFFKHAGASYQGQAVTYWLLLILCVAGLFLPSLLIHFSAAVYDTYQYTDKRLSDPTYYSNYHMMATLQVKDMAENATRYFHEAGFASPEEVKIGERSDIPGIMSYAVIDSLGEFFDERTRAHQRIKAYEERSYRLLFLREGRLTTKREREQGAKLALLGRYCPVDVGERLQIYGEDFLAIGRVEDFHAGVIIPHQAMLELVPYLKATYRFSGWGSYKEALPKIKIFHAQHPSPNTTHYERRVADYQAKRQYFWPFYFRSSAHIWIKSGPALMFGLGLMSLLVSASLWQKRRYYALHRSLGMPEPRQFLMIVGEVACLLVPASLIDLGVLYLLRKHLPFDFFYLQTKNAPLWTLLFALVFALGLGSFAAIQVMRGNIADTLREGA